MGVTRDGRNMATGCTDVGFIPRLSLTLLITDRQTWLLLNNSFSLCGDLNEICAP